MSDDENRVISFKTRRSLAETQAEEKKLEETIKVTQREGIESQLEAIDKLRHLVASGKVENLVLMGASTEHPGVFYTDVAFGASGISCNEATTWVGKLELMKLELSEVAFDANELDPDGNIMTPAPYDEDEY